MSDEELNLINGYNTKKEDVDFLLSNNLIRINEDSGMVEFLDESMSTEAKYGDIKAKADLGMLYSAKRSANFMVVQLSPKIIDSANRFILLTYNYEKSLMQTFLTMHGYLYKKFDEVTLYKTDEEIKKDLLERIEFIESPSVKKVQDKHALSKSWWLNATPEKRKEVSRCIRSCMAYSGTKRDNMFYTLPRDFAKNARGFETKFIGSIPRVDSDGFDIEFTRTFVACNARSTNKYADKTLAVHAYNLFPNQAVKAFIQGQGHVVHDDVFALNTLLQWLFRGCIRKKGSEKMKVAILSSRMSILFKLWLTENQRT